MLHSQLSIIKQLWFEAFTDFHGIKSPTMANFKQWMCCHWTWSWEETQSVLSTQRKQLQHTVWLSCFKQESGPIRLQAVDGSNKMNPGVSFGLAEVIYGWGWPDECWWSCWDRTDWSGLRSEQDMRVTCRNADKCVEESGCEGDQGKGATAGEGQGGVWMEHSLRTLMGWHSRKGAWDSQKTEGMGMRVRFLSEGDPVHKLAD